MDFAAGDSRFTVGAWARTGCGAIRKATGTITLTKNAPASGLSPYVTGRLDHRPYPITVGDSRLMVGY